MFGRVGGWVGNGSAAATLLPSRMPMLPARSHPPPCTAHSCPLQVRPEEVELIRRDYTANCGWETFLEYGDPRQVGGRLQHVAVPVYCLLPGSRCPLV
jgi:hypothetical protein